MASSLSVPKPSGFHAMPLEIRQQIYRWCIPRNLFINVCDDMYWQERYEGWKKPPWHTDPFFSDERGTYYSSKVENCEWCDRQVAMFADKSSVPRLFSPASTDYCSSCRRYSPNTPPSRQSALPGLLLICRQITEEVEILLYGDNTFGFDFWDNDVSDLEWLQQFNAEWLGQFDPDRRHKMRKIELVLRHLGGYFPLTSHTDIPYPYILNHFQWDDVFENVTTLSIRLLGPKPYPSLEELQSKLEHKLSDDMVTEYLRKNAKAIKMGMEKSSKELRKWVDWILPILEYIGQVIPQFTQIVVHKDEEEKTIQLLEEKFPGRCLIQELDRI
ncbi:uncharacterized protein GGS25DRAFT_486940 [Hypoxylon fragiforme]|uniref:uncharacterized protein n=1 Tax=Hypoxylon fragiforme TaxID=63214 RepID=UPI0020C67C56|nr:uncharacterized protein GGS25DRAFT_486940 [Hypoxylon fragiforme]KAI2609950.1 hypothetical protein GGS25DRAFT_486940 [Hypoxylon fragiforme]